MKKNKIWFYALIAIDIALTIFLLVVSVIMFVKSFNKSVISDEEAKTFIGWLQLHPGFFLGLFVIPLFVLLIGNVVGLALFIKKASAKEKVKLENLSEEDKAKLLQEMISDSQKGASEEKKEE